MSLTILILGFVVVLIVLYRHRRNPKKKWRRFGERSILTAADCIRARREIRFLELPLRTRIISGVLEQ